VRRVPALLTALSKDWLRNREAVFFAFLFPVVLLVIFSAVFGGGVGGFTVYVQNQDRTADGEPTNLSETFVTALNETDVLSVRTIDPDRNVTAWNRESDTTGATRVVVVPDGFDEQVRAGSARARRAVILDTVNRALSGLDENETETRLNGTNRTEIRRGTRAMTNGTNVSGPAEIVFYAASDDETAPAVRGVLGSVVARFNDEALGVEEPPTTVTTGDLGSRNLTGVDYFLPALIAAVVLINGLVTLPSIVAGFGSDGTLKRLAATPLRKRDWILANVVMQAVLAVLVTALMVVVAHLAFGVTVIPGPLSIALILLGAVTFAGFGMALGSLVRSPDAATSLGMAVALPTMFVSGVFWELDLMPASLQTAATLLPVYHFHRGLRRLMVLDTTDGVAVPFAILGVGAALALVAAIRLTTWQDL